MKSVKAKFALDKVTQARKTLFKIMAIRRRETELISTEAKSEKV